MATRQGVSDSLDAISQDPGAIMIRSGDLWVPAVAPSSGLVPVSQSGPPYVKWDTSPGAGGSGATLLATNSTPTGQNITITGLSVPATGQLEIRLKNALPASANGSLWLRLQVGGSWATTGYNFFIYIDGSNGVQATNNQQNFVVYDLTGVGSTNGVSTVSLGNTGSVIRIPCTDHSRDIPIYHHTSYLFANGTLGYCHGGGGLTLKGQITGVRIQSSSGNLTTAQMSIIHYD